MFTSPSPEISAYTCPHCGIHSAHEISNSLTVYYPTRAHAGGGIFHQRQDNLLGKGIIVHCCESCNGNIIYIQGTMIFPLASTAPLPTEDMPEDVKEDYLEARVIANLSPRGACALLRLGLQKLCKHLGEEGRNINNDIGELVKKGLHPSIQQALDSVRVVGNEAVHPGTLDLKDDVETASKLFGFLNIIVEALITQPKQIEEYYNLNVPENKKAGIAQRDQNS